MKVVDLVTHTSGLTYGFLNRTSVDAAYRQAHIAEFNAEGGLDGMIEQLSSLPLEFSPGTQWNYSVSIDVMGYLVQKLSGMSFGEFLRTRLFEPLGMTDTAFWCPPEKRDRFASCYQPKEGGGIKLQDDAGNSSYAKPPNLESGGGGLVSTAHDYMRFCRMMLGGGTLDGVQILSPKTVALFSLNHLPDNKELADMAPPGNFSESGYSGVGFSIGCGVNINVAKTRLPGTVGRILLGRRRLHRVLDRPEGGPRGGVHDAGHRQRRPADAAAGPAHAGVFGDDGIVRVAEVSTLGGVPHRAPLSKGIW